MAKKLREIKLHSRTLLPKDVADKGKEAVELFNEKVRPLYYFTEGESVVHVDNYDQVLKVQEIVRKEEKIRGQIRNRLDGIKCIWWEESD